MGTVLDVLVASIDHNYPTIVNAGGDRIGVLLGTGTNGSLGPKVDFADGAGTFSVTVGDVNKDGKPDLVITNWASTRSRFVSTWEEPRSRRDRRAR